MTNDAPLIALQKLGFTERQAAFLSLVLLNSGHFLRRQYTAFRGAVDGARTTEFLARLVNERLAAKELYWRQTHVYRLSPPGLYARVGQRNSRLRRRIEPTILTQRLMTLDVLVAHRHLPSLATEADKVRYFTKTYGVPLHHLPSRQYRSERPGVPDTVRYFVDRVPILLGERITFVFVPTWDETDAFPAFLRTYGPLFQYLPNARILLCTSDGSVAQQADQLCEERFPPVVTAGTGSAARALVLAHFRERRRFELREFRSFTQAGLEQVRRDRERYSGAGYDEWYARWNREMDGVATPDDVFEAATNAAVPLQFDVFQLPFQYPCFGRVRSASWSGV